ncbi:hypothetical protein FKW77_002879 [Venturia effusa]|uniref:Uncharacterized protein n=1 Tax=Venturia effusa TaxID=50376 RepID=A0A517LJV9_9PEZI|nr:hypothetical protein FKW77_002879 [Venturia effusa]
MATPRSSPLRAFKQPASPKMDSNASQQRMRAQVRQQSAGSGPTLRLPGLPRYHPANFSSTHSSLANTPSSGVNSPQAPMSPRAQQRYQSEVQRQLYSAMQHRRVPSNQQPISPRLRPKDGSPGPVTPLELEADNYLVVGSGSLSPEAQAEYVDSIIREQAARSRREPSASPRRGRDTSVGYN